MGSHTFEDIIYGYNANQMEEAYQALCDRASREYGTDPYNGTISTTGGVQRSPISTTTPIPLYDIPHKDFDHHLDNLDKWGPCEGIYICASTTQREHLTPKTTTATITVPTEIFDLNTRWEQEQMLAALLTDKLPTISRDNPNYTKRITAKMKPHITINFTDITVEPVEKKTVTTTGKGTKKTRYFIINDRFLALPEWEDGYDTFAEAKNNLPIPKNTESYSVIGITRKDSGEALVSKKTVGYKKKTTTATVSFTVEYRKPVIDKKNTGWMFYGWAAS